MGYYDSSEDEYYTSSSESSNGEYLRPCLYQRDYTNDTPSEVFRPGLTPNWNHCDDRCINSSNRCDRLVSIYDPHAILIYVDGCCLNNGQDDPQAGSAFIHTYSRTTGNYSGRMFRLEERGPTGRWYKQTSNRAELRAVIAALRCRNWPVENVRRLVIATDSEYIAKGCTSWLFKWADNGWVTLNGRDVANQDLWQLLLNQFDNWSSRGLQIEFWRIPRELNEMADGMAKNAAEFPDVEEWDTDF